ncbi:MAG TPA: hypothetical protein VLX29_02520 [Nitrospirota bacterium]|nr:hypothetical protein [Nitrospirota bacterium]
MKAVRMKDFKSIESMAKELLAKGADVINVQVSLDGIGDEEDLPFVTDAVQGGAGVSVLILGT